MDRKPDIIRAIVLVFAVGLVITGFTSLQASEESRSATPTVGVFASETEFAPVARLENR